MASGRFYALFMIDSDGITDKQPCPPGRSRDSRMRIAVTVLCVVGGMALALGLLAIGTYISGVVDVIDQPDRSWIFWGLVFLYFGTMLVVLAVGLLMIGMSWLRRLVWQRRRTRSGQECLWRPIGSPRVA